jgi:hypothetical protein
MVGVKNRRVNCSRRFVEDLKPQSSRKEAREDRKGFFFLADFAPLAGFLCLLCGEKLLLLRT